MFGSLVGVRELTDAAGKSLSVVNLTGFVPSILTFLKSAPYDTFIVISAFQMRELLSLWRSGGLIATAPKAKRRESRYLP